MVAFTRRLARGAKGHSVERLVATFWVRAGMMCVGLLACGLFLAVNGPQHELMPAPDALAALPGGGPAPAATAVSAAYSADFMTDVVDGAGARARLLLLKDGVKASGYDDDAVVYNSETNPTGQITCKSNDQVT
jgi:hypothetical protein